MREYTWPKRKLMDAVLYFVKTGCQWRNLPHDFPPYSTVHSFYRGARLSGLWDKTLEHLIVKTRTNVGRSPELTYAPIDSQSVKTVAASEERGIGGRKNKRKKTAHCCRCYGNPACGCCTRGQHP
ncbi:MAG: transposase [Syntrophomonadaceae bacterium]|nr:transposase [Syntrophomonadaceae bacterium]